MCFHCRGPQVDTDALLKALHAGQIRAALDVTDPEPLPPDHPLWQVRMPACLTFKIPACLHACLHA